MVLRSPFSAAIFFRVYIILYLLGDGAVKVVTVSNCCNGIALPLPFTSTNYAIIIIIIIITCTIWEIWHCPWEDALLFYLSLN
jgi:hypothetical protein